MLSTSITYYSTIFKTITQSLEDVYIAGRKINELNNLKLNTTNITAYATALKGLNANQAELVLSTQGLTLAQKQAILSQAELLGATGKLTTAELEAILVTKKRNKDQAEALLINTGLITSETAEATATNVVTTAKLKELVATGKLTQAEANLIAAKAGVTLANQKESASLLAGIGTKIKGAGTALKGLGTGILTIAQAHPVIAGITAALALCGGTALVNKIKQEKAAKAIKEAYEEAKKAIEEINNTYSTNSSQVKEISKEYAELAQGVDLLTNSNRTLSTEKHERFLELSNQLSKLYPSLTKNFDDNGNAILDLSGDVDTIVGSLDDLIERQRVLANQEIVKQMPDLFAGYSNNVADLAKQREEAQNTRDEIQKAYEEIEKYGLYTAFDINGKAKDENRNFVALRLGEYKSLIEKLNISIKEEILKDGYGAKIGTKLVLEDGSDINLDYIKDAYVSAFSKASDDIKYAEQQFKAETSSINQYLNTWLQTEFSYNQIEDNGLQKAIQETLFNFDWSKLPEGIDKNDWEAVSEYLRRNILFSINNINDSDVSKALSDIYSGALTSGKLLEAISKVQEYFGAEHPISISLQSKVDDTQPLINNVKEKLQDDFDDKVGELTLDELQIAAEQIEVPEGTLLSWDELIAKIEKAKKEATNDKPITLFTQLTTSQEALDKFQSSAKSAADAYTTLLSGNYSTNELLDSIQAINQAVTDMGGTLNWEYIANQSIMEPLDLLGEAIEDISKRYAESILSGAGIDVNSDFGQMLTNMIQQMYETEAEFAGMNAQLDNLQSSYQTLTGILESYNETGYISLDNLQSLLTADENLISMLEVENGQLVLNQEAYENLVAAQLMEFKTKLNDAAAAEIEALAKQKAEQATNQNADASQNAVAKLDAETAAFNRNTTAAISNAVAKAEESGVSEEEIQGIFDKYTEVWNAAMDNYSGDFDGFMGGSKSASKSGKEAGDAYVDAFEEELKDLQNLRDQGVIDEAEYLRRLKALYSRYFKDRKEYLDEFKKYEREYLEGMKSLYDSALSGITKLMDSKIDGYEDAKEAAINALEEERDAIIATKEAEKERYEQQIKLIEKQIDAKQDEIDAINDAAEARAREVSLQEAQYKLEKLQNNRTIFQYSSEKGLHYEVDPSGIRDAKEEVDSAKREIEIANIEKEIELLEDQKELLNEQIDLLDEQIDKINEYFDNLIKEQEKFWDSMIKNMEQQKSKWEELAEIEEIAQAYSAIEQVFGELGYTVEDVLNGNEQAFEDFKSRYIAIMSDMNQNTSFQEGLEYASGVAKENFGSIVSDAQSAAQDLSGTFSDGTFTQAITQGISDGIASAKQELDNMDQLGRDAGDGLINGWTEKVDLFIEAVKQAAIDAVEAFAEGQDSHSPSEEYKAKASDAIDGLLLGIEENKQSFIDAVKSLAEEGVLAFEEGFNFENSTLNTSFDALKLLIESVTEALGIGTGGAVGGLLGALDQLSKFSFNEDGIITQFTNLKNAIDEVTSAISGGGASSGSEGQGSNSGSTTGNKSGGKTTGGEGSANSLTGAINEIGTTASEVIGEPDAEGDGTVIGEFGSLETAVTDVTTAIGGGDSEGSESSGSSGSSGEEDDNNLIGSIVDLGETTEEVLGEPGGDGAIGKFEKFKVPIQEADEHIKSISNGLNEIDGKTVECTIKVTIETSGGGLPSAIGSGMNLGSATYNAKYLGNSHVEGTALASGNWAVQSNEQNALLGEIGYEIVVRNGRFFTVGDNGPEMFPIKKGDIVFNHEQSKELLKNGHTSGRGKAYADGTVGGGKVLTPDGKILRPLQSGDKGYDLMKAFEPLVEKVLKGEEDIVSNAVFDGQRQMEQWTKEITNNTVINNIANNRNVQPEIHQTFNITLPNVTNNTSADKLMNDLQSLATKKFQVNW